MDTPATTSTISARTALPGGIALDHLDSGSGSPLLLLHGGMGDCHSWSPQMQALARTHRVIAPSRRHASSNPSCSSTEPHSLELDVDDLAAFRRSLRLGAAHLVGTSYGALVALAYALRHPAEVLSLTLAEPPLHRLCCRTEAGARLFEAFMADVWTAARTAFDAGDDRLALQLLTDGIWGRPTFERLSAARRAAVMRHADSMRALTRARDPFPELDLSALAATRIPVLLINGEHASALHRCGVEEMKRALPTARHCVVSAAGHGSPFENPAGFNAAVLGFLAETAA